MITRLPNPNTTKRIKCGHDQLICKSAGYVFAGGYEVTSVAAACSFPSRPQFGKDSGELSSGAAGELGFSDSGSDSPGAGGFSSCRFMLLRASLWTATRTSAPTLPMAAAIRDVP